MIGGRAWSPPAAAASTGSDVPGYLLRSSYLGLSSPAFRTRRGSNVTDVKLEAVADLSAAATDKEQAGSEDAFALAFSSSAPLEAATHTFSHPDLGDFDFFIAPVEDAGMYEVVVNRSVAAPKHAPKRHSTGTATAPGSSAAAAKSPDAKRAARSAHVRRISARRLARGVACELALESHANVKAATVWLTRGGLVVATVTQRHVHGRRVTLRLPTTHRPRGGHYEVTVATKDRHGHTEYKRAKIVLH
jgi:hypothetical protein